MRDVDLEVGHEWWVIGDEIVQRIKVKSIKLLKYLKQLSQAIHQAVLCACVYACACA